MGRLVAGGIIGAVAAFIAQFLWLAPEASFWSRLPDVAALVIIQVLFGGLVAAGLLFVGLRVASAPVERHAQVALGALVGGVVVTGMFLIVGVRDVGGDPAGLTLSLVMVVLRAAPGLAVSGWTLAHAASSSWPHSV